MMRPILVLTDLEKRILGAFAGLPDGWHQMRTLAVIVFNDPSPSQREIKSLRDAARRLLREGLVDNGSPARRGYYAVSPRGVRAFEHPDGTFASRFEHGTLARSYAEQQAENEQAYQSYKKKQQQAQQRRRQERKRRLEEKEQLNNPFSQRRRIRKAEQGKVVAGVQLPLYVTDEAEAACEVAAKRTVSRRKSEKTHETTAANSEVAAQAEEPAAVAKTRSRRKAVPRQFKSRSVPPRRAAERDEPAAKTRQYEKPPRRRSRLSAYREVEPPQEIITDEGVVEDEVTVRRLHVGGACDVPPRRLVRTPFN